MKSALFSLPGLTLIVSVACGAMAVPDFERDVAPIFEGRCLTCHDGAHAKGDLKLDTREHAMAVMVPGKPERSRLIEQVSGVAPEMPKKGEPLAPAQIETLRRWIAVERLTKRRGHNISVPRLRE